jgi:hypothetical protein
MRSAARSTTRSTRRAIFGHQTSVHPLGSALVVLVGFSDDCRLIVPVLVLFVFFVLVIIIVVGISRRHRAADDGYEAPIDQPEGLGMLGVMSALLFGCRDIHGRILAREPGGPRKGAAIRLPLERESMALDRSKRPPRSGHGRPPFWERPSLALPDLWEPRRGCANYAPLGGAVNANGDRGSLVAPGPVALVLRPGWLQTAARTFAHCNALFLEGGFVAIVWHNDRERHRRDATRRRP